jgi:alkylation response protein AidB-like acyl-CoA dehydrogenase
MTMGRDFIAEARQIGPKLAERAAAADRDGAFVSESYELLADRGFVGMAVPASLGGGGASHAEASEALRELGKHCGSTALALSMHTHLVAATVWKHLRGQPGEALLRRVASERLVLVSTGAGDFLESNGRVTRVEGGYRVTAIKPFASGSPVGKLIITSAAYEDPEQGPRVLHFPVPMDAPGVHLERDWNSMGMRGTGSHTIRFEDVFVPDAAIGLDRPRAGWPPVWSVVLTVAAPMYIAPYVGVAEAAAEQALAFARVRTKDTTLHLLAGELENERASLALAFRALVENARNYDFAPELSRANQALIYKTLVAKHAIAVAEKATEIVGGRAYLAAQGMERLLRDVHGAPFHPLPEKRQQLLTGRLALGLEPV